MALRATFAWPVSWRFADCPPAPPQTQRKAAGNKLASNNFAQSSCKRHPQGRHKKAVRKHQSTKQSDIFGTKKTIGLKKSGKGRALRPFRFWPQLLSSGCTPPFLEIKMGRIARVDCKRFLLAVSFLF